jgi:ABC-type multidrug transport system ATPase subunit
MLNLAPMKISLTNAGKRFNREWIFKGVTLEFSSHNAYAITGPNGSGKSTLLQAIGGMLQLSEGGVEYETEGQKPEARNKKTVTQNHALNAEDVYKGISFCAPYLDVIEEMTLTEFLHFHQQFKSFLPSFSVNKLIDEMGMGPAANKQIRYFSSGMKQRVKLAQAIFSDTDVVLLDEPCSNLDSNGISQYHSLINNYCKKRLVIVSSNDEAEYNFCNNVISVLDFKH